MTGCSIFQFNRPLLLGQVTPWGFSLVLVGNLVKEGGDKAGILEFLKASELLKLNQTALGYVFHLSSRFNGSGHRVQSAE